MLLDTPSTMPDGKGAPSGGNTGASDGPPLPIGVDQGNGEPRDPIRETPPVERADAGVPSRDAGADAGPG
jgi:hypothetical protein